MWRNMNIGEKSQQKKTNEEKLSDFESSFLVIEFVGYTFRDKGKYVMY